MSQYLGHIIKQILEEEGYMYVEKQRTIYTVCPRCGKSDKLSILKENGATICYRGKCQFKGWFTDWLALSLGISKKEAYERLYNYGMVHQQKLSKPLCINLVDSNTPTSKESFSAMPPLLPILWDSYNFLPIDHPNSVDGLKYVLNRGLTLEIAKYYNLHYSPSMRRVIIPIMMDGQYYGWQGRAIDPVDSSLKMRNNVGLRRAELIMFADSLKKTTYAIVTEGPFDAMKFFKVGGAVATMGKIVTPHQLKIILRDNIKSVYLALDDDAVPEMRELLSQIRLPVYKINVPHSCVQRAQLSNKKADFGECTLDECVSAFYSATSIGRYDIALHLQKK